MLIERQSGMVQAARFVQSPNFDHRPLGAQPEVVIVHSISLPPGEFGGDGVERFFTNRLDPNAHPYYPEIAHLKVSAHLFLRRDGSLLQFVSLNDRAWHAGVSWCEGRERVNDFSIGIEVEGTDDLPFEAVQYASLGALLKGMIAAYPNIKASRVYGHEDISPGRKTDPGPFFGWPGLLKLIEA